MSFCAEVEEALGRKIFRLALALATVPSQLVHLQEQRAIPEAFSSWAMGQLDERVMSRALEYAHDAEVMVHLLSFKGGTFDSLRRAIEDLYQQEKISGRVLTHFLPQESPCIYNFGGRFLTLLTDYTMHRHDADVLNRADHQCSENEQARGI